MDATERNVCARDAKKYQIAQCFSMRYHRFCLLSRRTTNIIYTDTTNKQKNRHEFANRTTTTTKGPFSMRVPDAVRWLIESHKNALYNIAVLNGLSNKYIKIFLFNNFCRTPSSLVATTHHTSLIAANFTTWQSIALV